LTAKRPPEWLDARRQIVEERFVAITLHRISGKLVCGVVTLARQPDRSWWGKCGKCGEEFRVEPDARFEGQVRAMRN
jgi:hypothetical protein